MSITLITFDGFVKQLNYEPPEQHRIKLATRSRSNYNRLFNPDSVYDHMADVQFDTREFYRVGNTNVYEER